jgi:tetratricopeptide (TPR) repeat protein
VRDCRSLLCLAFLVTIATVAARPIEVEVALGRYSSAVKLVEQAQDQLFKNNNVTGARRTVEAAIRADPTYWPAFYIRAEVLIQQRQYEAAIQDCERILRQDSSVVEAALLRAEVNYYLGRCALSLKEAEHCIGIRPRTDAWARAYNLRALLHLYCHDPSIRSAQKAVSDATTACRLMAWSDGELIDTLATAEAATGNFDAAVKHEQQAFAAAKVREDEKRQYEKHLAIFEQHKSLAATAP